MENHARVTGIIFLIVGVILLVWPGSTLGFLCRMLGWCLVIGGVIEIAMGVIGNKVIESIIGGVIAVVFGVVFIARPDLIISFLPFAVGLVTAVGGAGFLIKTIVQKEYGPVGILTIIGSIVAVIAGIILMFNAYEAVKLLMIVLGLFLIYFGILRIIRS